MSHPLRSAIVASLLLWLGGCATAAAPAGPAAAGGSCTYSGRDMKAAHAGMGVTSAQFDALAGHLVEALDKFKVPEKEKSELLALVAPTRADIVEEP